MARSIATISGTAVRPGVSRNGRLYTREMIGRMVARAQQRIDADGMPVTMRVAHPKDHATAPVTETVGRVTRMWQHEDGSAKFTSVLADTDAGRTVAKLVDTRGGPPFVRGVSIRGTWVGSARRVMHQGQQVETGDDLDLDGLDFTHKPGVDGAGVENVDVDDDAMETARPPDDTGWIMESVQDALIVEVPEVAPTSPSRFEVYESTGLIPHVFEDGHCTRCGY